jgi:hypothetical protein
LEVPAQGHSLPKICGSVLKSDHTLMKQVFLFLL